MSGKHGEIGGHWHPYISAHVLEWDERFDLPCSECAEVFRALTPNCRNAGRGREDSASGSGLRARASMCLTWFQSASHFVSMSRARILVHSRVQSVNGLDELS